MCVGKKRRAVNAAIRCALPVVLVLAGLAMLSGCTTGRGSAANNPALASKVQTAINAAGNAKYVEGVTAQSDGKVTVTLSEAASMGDTKVVEKMIVPMIAVEVLRKVPEVKKLTVAWDATHPIGVWTAK
jgi:hypothetical protein